MKKGIFLTLLFCGVAVADMSRNGSIVTDNKTKLMWLDNNDATIIQRDWQGAIDYCESLTLGGYSDWRLPNIRELQSITDRTRNNPAINSIFQAGSSLDNYWSSTSMSGIPSEALCVHFYYGEVDSFDKVNNQNYLLRCVRTKQ
jgi:hypothetical protein